MSKKLLLGLAAVAGAVFFFSDDENNAPDKKPEKAAKNKPLTKEDGKGKTGGTDEKQGPCQDDDSDKKNSDSGD